MITRYNNHPLCERNSFRVEEQCDLLIEFDDKADLDHLFAEGNAPQKWYVLGGGNNTLFTKRYEGVLIHPTACNITPLSEDNASLIVEVDAAVEWDDFVEWTTQHGLWGAENLSLIPGAVGASPVQNIGAYGAEAKDIIHRVNYFDTTLKQHLSLSNAECHFAYRDSIFKRELRGRAIITSVVFCLSKEPRPNLGYGDLAREVEQRGGPTLTAIRDAVSTIRRRKLPDTSVLGNAGSFFKNPIVDKATAVELQSQYEAMPIYPTAEEGRVKLAAGWLIDQAGMKGYRQGCVGVHTHQALVLVNYGGATGGDVKALAGKVQQRVKERFGIEIEPEVNIL